MREILFRGKRIDNGEWVEGHYGEYMLMSGYSISGIVIPKNALPFIGITMPDRGEIWDFDGITCANKMEVIGNIHDNPELLEVTE